MDFDRFPRIPRRREPLIAGIINWTLGLGLAVFIGWLAAQGF